MDVGYEKNKNQGWLQDFRHEQMNKWWYHLIKYGALGEGWVDKDLGFGHVNFVMSSKNQVQMSSIQLDI